FAETIGLRAQLGVGEGLHVLLQAVHMGDQALEALEGLAFTHPDDAIEDRHVRDSLTSVGCERGIAHHPIVKECARRTDRRAPRRTAAAPGGTGDAGGAGGARPGAQTAAGSGALTSTASRMTP